MHDDAAAVFKYAALILHPPQGPDGRVVMYGGKETFAGNILKLVPRTEHKRWREWVGSVAWGRIEHAERVVVLRAASNALSTLNGEEQFLRQQVDIAWTAFLLTGASHGDAPAWLMTGEAAGVEHGAPLLTLNTAQQLEQLVQPIYAHRPRFIEIQADAFAKQWATSGKPDESWFSRWVEFDDLLGRRTPFSTVLAYALMSFGSARARRFLEFSIPEFVRAAEGVIAIPRGPRMKAVFVDRALRITRNLRTDKYVGDDIEGLLPELYGLRSDCIHGKLPFEKLQALGVVGEERAAQLAYVSELLAREALLVALRHPDVSIFQNRETLERAWVSGGFPSGA